MNLTSLISEDDNLNKDIKLNIGLNRFSEKIGSVSAPSINLLTSNTGTGKSTLLRKFALNSSLELPTAFISTSNNSLQLKQNFKQSLIREIDVLEKGLVDIDEHLVFEYLEKMNLESYSIPYTSYKDVLNTLDDCIQKGIQCIMVDDYNSIDFTEKKKSKTLCKEEFTAGLIKKTLAHNLIIFISCQQKPSVLTAELTDIDCIKQLKEVSCNIWSLYRPDFLHMLADGNGNNLVDMACLKVLKGENGAAKYWFKVNPVFFNIIDELEEQPEICL